MARKKKRSAKQLANDKRLGRMAKARAKKKRGGRSASSGRSRVTRKKVRRKNTHRRVASKGQIRRVIKKAKRRTKRPSLKKSHLWRVFRCRGKSVFWIYMDSTGKWNWTSDAGKSILFATKGGASNVAKGIAKKPRYAKYDVGVVDRGTTAVQIAQFCRGK